MMKDIQTSQITKTVSLLVVLGQVERSWPEENNAALIFNNTAMGICGPAGFPMKQY